jgi:hypothetical protein
MLMTPILLEPTTWAVAVVAGEEGAGVVAAAAALPVWARVAIGKTIAVTKKIRTMLLFIG